MKNLTLLLLCSFSCVAAFSQRLPVHIATRSKAGASFTMTDSLCGNASVYQLAEGEVVFLLGVKACSGQKKLKGPVYFEVIRDDQILYCPAETMTAFSIYPEIIVKDYAKLNEQERSMLRQSNLDANRSFYTKLKAARERERLDAERVRLEAEKKKEEELLYRQRYEQQVKELMNRSMPAELKQNSADDSLRSIERAAFMLKEEQEYAQSKKEHDDLLKNAKFYGGVVITEADIFENEDDNASHAVIFIRNLNEKAVQSVVLKLEAFTNGKAMGLPLESAELTDTLKGPTGASLLPEHLWPGSDVSQLKVKSVKVTFTDGSVKTCTDMKKIDMTFENWRLDAEYNNYTYTMIGGLSLQEHTLPSGAKEHWITFEDIYTWHSPAYFEVHDENRPLMISELEKALACRKDKNCTITKSTYFRVKDYSRNIYFMDEEKDVQIQLTVKQAEELLGRLKGDF